MCSRSRAFLSNGRYPRYSCDRRCGFVATNIDDIFVLMMLFTSLSFPVRHVVLGQYLGWTQRISHNNVPSRTIDTNEYLHKPTQLTQFVDESVRYVFSTPADDRSLIFFADYQGTENYQIYSMDLFNRGLKPITHNPEVKYEWGAECFSNDGQHIVYSSNEKSPSDLLIYVIDVKKQNGPFCITNNAGWYEPGYWSPDNKMINCKQILTDTDSLIWLLDVEKRKMIQLKPLHERNTHQTGPWSVDGRGFYVITNIYREHTGLAFYDIMDMKMEWIVTPDWDIEMVKLSRDNTTLVWAMNEAGYSKLFTKNLKTSEIQEMNLQNKGVIEGITVSPDGKRIGLLMSTPTSPSNAYIIDTESQKIVRITNAFPKSIPQLVLSEPHLSSYTSFDGLKIPFLLYRPEEGYERVKKSQKIGVILSIHGGPTAQERPEYVYSGLYQYLLSRGIAILAPNFRGSTGLGRRYEKMIYHDWGGNELKDFEYAIKWLLLQEWVDRNRIGIFGKSFGGFAVLSCISRLPQYWRAAVDIFGPSNLITTTTPIRHTGKMPTKNS